MIKEKQIESKIGLNLKKKREELGLTLIEVAEDIKTTPQNISYMERSATPQAILRYLKMLAIRGVNIIEILETTTVDNEK